MPRKEWRLRSSDNPPHQTASQTELRGVLERITFQNQENGFTVARVQEAEKTGQLTTVVGALSGIPIGSTLALSGWWLKDARHGRQFKVNTYTVLTPNTINGITRYLGSGLIKGIGPKYAARIVKQFGLTTLDILEQAPQRLLEVPGLGEKRVGKIKNAWADQKEVRSLMIFLQGHGISATFAVKIYKVYGSRAIEVIQENPYRLADDIWGIGFKTADRIAQAMGIPGNDPRRARSGLLFTLNEATNDGHCFLPKGRLMELAGEILSIVPVLLEDQIPSLILDEKVVLEDERVYLASLYYAEKGVAANIRRLCDHASSFAGINTEIAVPWACARMRLDFAPEQHEAIKTALRHPLTIITGGPGTGKSTILKALLLILTAKGATVQLAAPTGRAAKRMNEATGQEARTIHRLLEFDPGIMGFKRNADHPLKMDFLVVDEASMMDVALANALLRAVPSQASVLLVGDVDQLPSVGPGSVLADIIESQKVPVICLTRIFRQGPGSLISLNAARIKRGEALDLQPEYKGLKDFYCIFRETPEEVENEILGLCRQRLPQKYGLDPIQDIQVLTPMRRGLIGTENLNIRLQEVLNPHGRPVGSANHPFRKGDKVMQIKNNYDKEVFNGDLGLVNGGDFEEQLITVNFDGRIITYEFSELNELVLAYAVTVHKSQGSEYPCVVMPVHTSHYLLLQRNLLYTGVTRGKRMVVLVGTRKALGIAIRNNKVFAGNTWLTKRLKQW